MPRWQLSLGVRGGLREMTIAEGSIGYRHLFEQARAQLEARRISVRLEFGPRVTPTDFEPLEQTWSLSIPPSLRQFYLETGNGLAFDWFLEPNVPPQPFCRLVVPTLAGLRQGVEYLRMLNECLVGYDFRESRDPEAARHQYQRQLTFFPFLKANVDLLCIEPTGGREVVVFHDREWSFYPTGDSGIRLADSLVQFWRSWSKVGFVEPSAYWWPRTVGNGGTILGTAGIGMIAARSAGA
jgi:hypothetical protein